MLVCPVCKTQFEDLTRRRCVNDFTPLEESAPEPQAAPSDDAKILAGRYRIERELGAGGMAVVYLAQRTHIGDLAAVKVMNRSVAADPESLARFEMEARLAASASHPNVVQIYDFGVTEERLPFLVMEYLEGPTLSEEIKRCGTLSLERALEIFLPVCSAISAAHASGLIHRDLKPSNIILQQFKGGGEFVKVVDFGIAKTVSAQSKIDSGLTQKGAVVGTLGYMSLEQVRGEELDNRSDVYSLGAVFYEMLTGRLPFQAATSAQMLVAMAREQPKSLKNLRPDVPTRIEQAVFKALSKDRNERQSSALEFAQQLSEAAARTRPIFVPRQSADAASGEYSLSGATSTTGNYAAVEEWRGILGTLNLDVCIGREREMEPFKENFQQAAAGQGKLLLLLGDPGSGKSHLLLEHQRWAEREGAAVLPARFYDYGGSRLAPYQVFLDTLRACLLGERLPPITQKMNIEQLKQQQEKGASGQLAEIIQYKTGVTIPEQAFSAEALAGTAEKWRVFEALAEIYKRMAKSSPLVFIFDDLHFADSLSLELLAYIIRNGAGLRIQVAGAALSESAKSAGSPLRDWLSKQIGHGAYRELQIAGLPRSQAEQFLAAVFGSIEIADSDVDFLWNETQGFPLYLIELLEHLLTSGKISREGNFWKASQFGALEVPPSVNNLVNAKLRRYDAEALEVFKYASVIGDEFQFEALAEVMGIDEDDLDDILREGVSGWLLKEQQSAVGDSFRFQHSLVRRALYNSMSKANRRTVHAKTAEALERLHASKKDRVIGQIAYHYYSGGEWKRSFEPSVKAGETARKREAFTDAANYFTYGKESLDQLKSLQDETDPKIEGKLYVGLAESLIHLSRFKEAETELAHIFKLAGKCCDPLLRAWGEYHASRMNHQRGAFARAVELARLGLESIEEANFQDGELYSKLLLQLGYTLWMTGELEAAIEPLEKAAQAAESSGDSRLVGWAISWLGIIHCFHGNGTLGLEMCEKALRLLRESGDRVSELLAWERVGVIYGMLWDQNRAIFNFEKGLELANTIGYKPMQSALLMNLGEANRLKGDFNQADAYFNQALTISRQIEQQETEALCIQNLGLTAISREQHQKAVDLLERALSFYQIQNRQNLEAEVYWALGRAKEGLGEGDESLGYYDKALIICNKLSYGDYQWRSLWGRASILAAKERRDEARTAIAEAINIIEALRDQLPEGTNIKAFQEDKQPAYDLSASLG